jgi:hypothetical protein
VSAARRSPSSADRFRAAAASRRRDAETGQAPERGTTARRTKPVRITVDLTPEDYRTMRRLVAELADRADVPTLAHSVMWRELLRLADSDPEVFDAIAARIRAGQD